MEQSLVTWRVHSEWMESQKLLPWLPFGWIRGPKSEAPQPYYPCLAVVYDPEAAHEAIHRSFGAGCFMLLTTPHGPTTAAEWERAQQEPGAVEVLPNQRERGIV